MPSGLTAPKDLSAPGIQQSQPAADLTTCNLLVVGSADDARPYLQAAQRDGRKVKIVAVVPVERAQLNGAGNVPDVTARVEWFLDQMVVDEIVVATNMPAKNFDRIGIACVQRGLAFKALIRLPEANFGRCRVSPLSPSSYLLSVDTVPQGRWRLGVKRLMDVVGAVAGLAVCGIAYLIYGLSIKSQSLGSVIFRQRRMGRNGRSFIVLKFRTMYADAEARLGELRAQNEMRGCMFKIADDPRVTAIGKMLRRRHLDELPQFWNVLRGEMSLVGPRPPTPAEVATYLNHHRRRLSMKPGVTGLWQIHGNHMVNDFEEIVKLDCKYIDEWSLLFDCKILVKTVLKVLRGDGC